MTMLASQITSLTVVYSIVYSGVNQRKHQTSASLAFVWEIHRGPVNFPHKWPVTRKMFPFDDVIMILNRYEHVESYSDLETIDHILHQLPSCCICRRKLKVIYIYIYLYITHTHRYIYIYIYIYGKRTSLHSPSLKHRIFLQYTAMENKNIQIQSRRYHDC